MSFSEVMQIVSALGTLLGLGGMGWRAAKWFANADAKLNTVDRTVRRVELHIRTQDKRITRLEEKAGDEWRPMGRR